MLGFGRENSLIEAQLFALVLILHRDTGRTDFHHSDPQEPVVDMD
jgi:hypothetical protein